MDSPPKDTDTCGHRAALASPARALPQEPTLTRGIYLEKRSYSLLIWKASSRVWHMTRTVTWEQDSSTQSPTPPQSPGPAQSPAACAHLSADQLHLLQRGQHEHCHLAHAGLGLAQDVHTQDGLGDVLVLDCGRKGGSAQRLAALQAASSSGCGRGRWQPTLGPVLEATVHKGAQDFGLQQEVPEAPAVDGHVRALEVFLGGRWGALRRNLRLVISS